MLEEFSKFWNEAGWLANFLTILLGIITIVGMIYPVFRKITTSRQKNSCSSILNYVKTNYSYNSVDVLKKRKIAIVDDQPENYPVDYLRESGFNINVYESVSLANYSFLESYDLIFLDITNVVKEDPQRGGFELMKRVRSEMESVITIGVSSKRFDPTLAEFFKLANEQSKTPISEKECEDLILRTLEKHYSPQHISGEIDSLINQSMVTQKQHLKILKVVTKYLNKDIDGDKFYSLLAGLTRNLDIYRLQKKCQSLKAVL